MSREGEQFALFRPESGWRPELIGPNGSGKSNLIEIISLFQAMPGT